MEKIYEAPEAVVVVFEEVDQLISQSETGDPQVVDWP